MLGQVVFASTALGLFTIAAIGVMVYMNYQQQQQQQYGSGSMNYQQQQQQQHSSGSRGQRRYVNRSFELPGYKPDHSNCKDKDTESALCSICQYEISETQRYTLSCKHSFHDDCIMAWISNKLECPNCRKKL